MGAAVAGSQGRGSRTADRVEAIAVDLVLERGLHDVTVDDICEQAGISQRTFFNHFGTKEEAVFGRDFTGFDEQDAREFLVSRSGDLIADVLRLLQSTQAQSGSRDLFLKRKRIIHSDAMLVSKHMARMRALRADLCDLIYLRIRGAAPDDETEAETREAAVVLAECAAALLRLDMEAELCGADSDREASIGDHTGAGQRLRAIVARAFD